MSIKYPPYKFFYFKNILLNQMVCNRILNTNIQALATKPYPMNIYLHSSGTYKNYHFSVQAKNKDIHWTIIGNGTCRWVGFQIHKTHILNGHLNARIKFIWSHSSLGYNHEYGTFRPTKI